MAIGGVPDCLGFPGTPDTVVVIDIARGTTKLQKVPEYSGVAALAISPDGFSISIGLDGYEEPLWIWMYPFTENPIAVVSVWDVVSLAYSSSGEIVIAFTWLSLEGDISIIDVDSCMVCRSFRVHCGTMYPIVTAMDL